MNEILVLFPLFTFFLGLFIGQRGARMNTTRNIFEAMNEVRVNPREIFAVVDILKRRKQYHPY